MARSRVWSEDIQSHLHQEVAGIQLSVAVECRLGVGHEVDFLHRVHSVGIEPLQLDIAHRLMGTGVKVVGEDHALALILRHIVDSRMVALIR